jgi:hypothetical protein
MAARDTPAPSPLYRPHGISASPPLLVVAFVQLDTVECVKRYFKTPAGMPWSAAIHRAAEFSEESRDQPRSLNALSSFMKRCV